MSDKNSRRNQTTDALFDAILSLETREECYNFFEDLCTVKEISDMAQRLEAAKMLLDGRTYDQIVKAVEISTPPSAASTAASSTAPAATARPLKRCAAPRTLKSRSNTGVPGRHRMGRTPPLTGRTKGRFYHVC